LFKKNFPSSQLFFIIFYSLKYIGLIVNSRIIEMNLNKDTISLNKYLCNFLIFGKSFSPIYSNYQLICFLGASFLLLFVLFSSFSFIYMKIKYQNINSLIQEKMENNNEKIEEIFFKIIAYIEIVILFFHQYILEYYFFGFYGFIYYKMGIFSKNGSSSKIYIDTLNTTSLYDYFLYNNHVSIFIINLIVIIYILLLFYSFLMFNTTKGLFLNHGLYCGNRKFVIMKLLLLSTQPIFGIHNFYSNESKFLIGLIINGIFIIFFSIIFLELFSSIWILSKYSIKYIIIF
jgi:hypothetical protein